MADQQYTRWAVLASGEGGGRIASNYFVRAENPGIDDRILVMNTNRADIRNVIDRMTSISRSADGDTMEGHALTFGTLDGVGNYFPGGEACARGDLDRIVNRIQDEGIDAADAFLYITTLGGGTGSGSVPYLIHELKRNTPSDALETISHVALAAWPYDHEGGQRHFNAVCGLSRLLRWYDNSQNSDLVLLVANSHIEESLETDVTGEEDEYRAVNERIITALDLMIGAGRETKGVVDVNDWIIWPSQLDAYHFTPGLATDMSEAFELEFIFDQAAENTFVPMDPTTARVVYAVVRAPKYLVEEGEYSEAKLERRLNDWTDEAGMNDVVHRMVSLTPVERADDSLDVLLLFGGFDLDPLLNGSRQSYDTIMEQATESGLRSNVDTADQEFSTDQFRKIRNNLDEYLSQNGG
jgi:hypothetical protein